tara:strand:- start:222 stop:566 length:345 start_codon:yes stop_codon:yes gene_type:complete
MPDSRLNPNRASTKHWRSRNGGKKADTEDAHALTLAHGLSASMPWSRAWVTITLSPSNKSPRDIDNFGAACKGFLDGITKAGVLTDDKVIQAITYQWGEIHKPHGMTEIEIDGE